MQMSYDKWWDDVRPYMVNEGRPKMDPNPYHLNYEEQLKSEGIPSWKKPQL